MRLTDGRLYAHIQYYYCHATKQLHSVSQNSNNGLEIDLPRVTGGRGVWRTARTSRGDASFYSG